MGQLMVLIHCRRPARLGGQIRADRGTWPADWDNKTLSPVGLGWTAEMFGCVSKSGRYSYWWLVGRGVCFGGALRAGGSGVIQES